MTPSELPRRFTVTRDGLMNCVRRAGCVLKDRDDRHAVVAFAEKAPLVAVGAWCLPSCRCPISAVGIDRLQEDAQMFAGIFDQYMCALLELDQEDAQATGVVVEVTGAL